LTIYDGITKPSALPGVPSPEATMLFSGFIFDVEGTLIDCIPQNLTVAVPYEVLQLYSGISLALRAYCSGSDRGREMHAADHLQSCFTQLRGWVG
jgi:hypothetical protein